MAHFAKLDKNNKVTQVIVVSNDDAPDPYPDSEKIGQAFIKSIGLTGTWKQTSYNANFRRKYAGIGDTFNSEHDGFVPPAPGENYTFDFDLWEWVENP